MAEHRPNNPNIARVTWQYLRDTRIFENTFHLYRSGGWSYADLVASLEAAYGLWNSLFKQCVPAAVSLFNVHGVVYDPTGSPWVADRPVSPALAGTRAGVAAPANVTITMSERANLAGRAYRGRIYLPAVSENDISTLDQVGSSLITALGVAASGWLGVFAPTGSVGTLVLFHRNDNLFSTVQTIVLESILDSQRRRLPGRGR